MGGFIVILLIIYFVVKKRKKDAQQSAASAKHTTEPAAPLKYDKPIPNTNNPASALLESPFYERYRLFFDLIFYNGKQEKYKIDWLLWSLDNGHEVDGQVLLDSMESNLPYFCETESEYDSLSRIMEEKCAVIESIVTLEASYGSWGTAAHPEKYNYWRRHLKEQAVSGNLEAQALLCNYSEAKLVFSKEEVEQFKNCYQDALLALAEGGDAMAQLAVGEYIAPRGSKESERWLCMAAEQGLSDAYYRLVKLCRIRAYQPLDANGLAGEFRRYDTVSDEDRKYFRELEIKALGYLFKGAEANSGIMAASCQSWLGDCYEDGETDYLVVSPGMIGEESLLPKDFNKAKYWYEKAAENGDERAKWHINFINNELSRM